LAVDDRGTDVAIAYLRNEPWSSWTREERYFCALLFSHASQEPSEFASWLIDTARLTVDARGEWDLGYEVCFYRDYLWQLGKSAKQVGLPTKRTFDLCLFGERDLIVIEAKVCEAYDGSQNEDFALDKARINSLEGLEGIGVHVVALASSLYFQNAARFSRPGTLTMFDGRITWAQIAGHYDDELLRQADRMYKLRHRIIDSPLREPDLR
jgi:hypothetical protein